MDARVQVKNKRDDSIAQQVIKRTKTLEFYFSNELFVYRENFIFSPYFHTLLYNKLTNSK